MTETPTGRPPDPPARPTEPPAARPSAGLRLRLWLACLGGSLVASGGVAWLLSNRLRGPAPDAATETSWLAAIAGFALLAGVALALWLDRAIVAHLRGLVVGMRTGQIAVLRGLPAASGWGELSQITQQIQLAITQQRQAVRAAEELGALRRQLTRLLAALATWTESERWPDPAAETGLLTPVIESLNRGFERAEELREQNVEVVRQVRDELKHALDDAREAAEQAEQGFVEATALLTTVRELQRLAAELGQALESTGREPQATATETLSAWRQAAREAIEELVASSTASVEHLSRGVVMVQDIAEQVQRLTNRSTLIALQASAPLATGAELDPEQREHIRRLVFEAREAADRTTTLVQEVREAVTAAGERMRGVRERVAARLDAAPPLPPARPGAAAPPEEGVRLLGRVREMVQDATRKGERLSSAGERVSRSTERLVRGLEEEIREVEALSIRFAPPELKAALEPSPVKPVPGAKETQSAGKAPAPPSKEPPPAPSGKEPASKEAMPPVREPRPGTSASGPETRPSPGPPSRESGAAPPSKESGPPADDPGRFRLLGPGPPGGESSPRRRHEERS
jgi:hypothetical protein